MKWTKTVYRNRDQMGWRIAIERDQGKFGAVMSFDNVNGRIFSGADLLELKSVIDAVVQDMSDEQTA